MSQKSSLFTTRFGFCKDVDNFNAKTETCGKVPPKGEPKGRGEKSLILYVV